MNCNMFIFHSKNKKNMIFINIIFVLAVIFICLFSFSCSNEHMDFHKINKDDVINNDPEESFGEKATLFVENKAIESSNAYIMSFSYTNHLGDTYDDVCIQLPLLEIVKELGADIKLIKNGNVRITLPNEDYYILSFSEKTLKFKETEEDLLLCAPGIVHYCALYLDGEIYLDYATCDIAIREMFGIGISIKIDNGKVFVTKYSG